MSSTALPEIQVPASDRPRAEADAASPEAQSSRELRILILTSIATDGALTAEFLSQAGLHSERCRDIPDLCARIDQGCGAILLAEESLDCQTVEQLTQTLSEQSSWSDIPIAIITGVGELSAWRLRRLTSLGSCGNVTLLERPFRRGTLVSTLEVALRARRRQYEVRQLLIDRQRTEDALRESEERARRQLAEIEAIYTMAPLGLCVLDCDLRFRRINQRLAAINGFSPEAHIGRTVHQIVPSLSSQAEEMLRRVLQTGEPVQMEFRGETPAEPGVQRVWDERWYPLRGRSGQIVGIGVVTDDITERIHREQALRDSERLLRVVAGGARVGLVIVDRHHRYLFANEAYTAVIGIDPRGVVGSRVPDVLPAAWPRIKEKLDLALAGQRIVYELDLTPPDDPNATPRVVSVLYEPHVNGEGEINVVAVVIDITARHLTEKALRESEHRLAEDLAGITVLHQLASRFVAKGDAQPILKDVVDAAIALTHADKGVLQLYHPETRCLDLVAQRGFSDDWVEFFRTVDASNANDASCGMAMGDGRRIIVEDVNTSPIFADKKSLAVQKKAGVRAVQSTPLFSRSGELLGVLSTHFVTPHRPNERELERLDLLVRQVADLLERAASELALRYSEERFRLLVSILTDVTWVSNPAGEFDGPQSAWEEYTGQKRQEYQGLGWRNAVHPDDRRSLAEAWRKSLQTGKLFESRHRMWNARTREWRHVSARACPLRHSDDSVREWVGTCTDIDDMVKAREALERHRQELEQLVAERTAKLKETVGELEAFSYSIAHDMRAPLRAMAGFSTILREDYGPQLDETAEMYLDRISNAAARLDRLIQDVLDYSRVVRSKPELEIVDTGKLLEEIVHTYPNMHPPKAKVMLAEPLPRVMANPAGLTQVFSNLLGNAVKFVAPGTQPQVRVWAEPVPHSPNPTSDPVDSTEPVEKARPLVRLWFEDNGIGMDPDGAKRVFQMFQRLVDAKSYEGTGIGLAIVKKSIERMGGEVGVESTPDQGSRFWVTLQLA